MQRIKKNYIIDEKDSLSEYNKIPLGHNRTNCAVYSKIYVKVDICYLVCSVSAIAHIIRY